MSITRLKDVIRHVRCEDEPATKKEIQEAIANNEAGAEVMESYQLAKRMGEIYEYPDGDNMVVKITDEVIA